MTNFNDLNCHDHAQLGSLHPGLRVRVGEAALNSAYQWSWPQALPVTQESMARWPACQAARMRLRCASVPGRLRLAAWRLFRTQLGSIWKVGICYITYILSYVPPLLRNKAMQRI